VFYSAQKILQMSGLRDLHEWPLLISENHLWAYLLVFLRLLVCLLSQQTLLNFVNQFDKRLARGFTPLRDSWPGGVSPSPRQRQRSSGTVKAKAWLALGVAGNCSLNV
jgi:hypothetical protein